MPPSDWSQFRQMVVQDPVLQRHLRAIADWATFVQLVVRLGQERGYTFTVAEVEQELYATRRAWLERWL